MLSSITTQRVLQGYPDHKTKPDTAVSTSNQPAVTAAEQQSTGSVRVSFSPAVQEKQRLKLSFNSYQQQMADTKKTKARERAAEIKQRVDQLKRLVSMFGALAPKALLRELKQLAHELKSTANELKEGWGGSAGNAISSNATEAEPETTAVSAGEAEEKPTDDTSAQQQEPPQAAEQAMQDGNEVAEADLPATTSLSQQLEKEQDQQQRREDQKLLQETAQELKALFNRLKALLRTEDNDKETQKQLGEINKLLTDTNAAAGQLTSGIEVSVTNVNIAVSV